MSKNLIISHIRVSGIRQQNNHTHRPRAPAWRHEIARDGVPRGQPRAALGRVRIQKKDHVGAAAGEADRCDVSEVLFLTLLTRSFPSIVLFWEKMR